MKVFDGSRFGLYITDSLPVELGRKAALDRPCENLASWTTFKRLRESLVDRFGSRMIFDDPILSEARKSDDLIRSVEMIPAESTFESLERSRNKR